MSVVELDIYAGTDPNGTALVTLTDDDFATFEMRDGENSLGSGSFSIRRDHAAATEANLATGNYVKVRIPIIDTDPVFGFWIDEHDDTILAYDEQGAEVLTRQGPGTLAILARAKFLEDNWAPVGPATDTRGTNNEVPGYWRWTHQPYGAIFKRFIEEGQNEPGEPLGDVTTDFDRDDDSDATPWPEIVRDVRFPIGTDGLELLQAFAQTGELYVRSTPDLLISGHQARGTNRTSATFSAGKVRFEKGVNINTDLSRAGQGILRATHALVVGSDFKYRRVVSPDYTSGTGRWITVDYPESNDDDVLDKVGLEELARGDAQQQSLTLEIKAGDDEGEGLYLPYLHFKTGDLVTLDTGSAAWDYDETSQLVAGFTIGIREASDDATDEMAGRSLIVNVELGGSSANGGFGDLSSATRAMVDDPFFVDDGVDATGNPTRRIRFRDFIEDNDDHYAQLGTGRGNLELDAFLRLDSEGDDINPVQYVAELGAFNTHEGDSDTYAYYDAYAEGQIDMLASFNWASTVDGLDDDSKHFFYGGWGIVLPILSDDPTSGQSEAAQVYYNDDTNMIRWHNGTIWQDVWAGGGGGGDAVDVTYDPAASGLAATDVQGAVDELAGRVWKQPVRAATTANITISTALNNGDTLDGATLATGDRVLVKNQSTGSQNGIYIVGASPSRALDFDAAAEVLGSVVAVMEGTVNADSIWQCTNDATITVGTTALDFRLASPIIHVALASARLGPGVTSILDAGLAGSNLGLYSDQVDVWSVGTMQIAVNNGSNGGGSDAKHYFYGGHGLVLPHLTADPSGGNSEDGQIYYNSATDKFRGRANGAWVDLN